MEFQYIGPVTIRKKLIPAYLIKEAHSFIMFSKGTDEQTIEKWRNAYETLIKKNYFDTMAVKWSKKLSAPIKFSEEKGFYVSDG